MLSGTEFLRMMQGNEAARRRAMDLVMPDIAMWACRRCQRWLGNADDAMDVAHDVCIKLIEGKYNGEQPLDRWLHKVINNLVTDIYRSRRPGRFVHLDQSSPDDPDSDAWATIASDQPGPGWHREVLGCLYKIVAVLEQEGPARKGSMRAYDFLLFLIQHEGTPSENELAAFLDTTVRAATERKRALLRDKLPPLCKQHCGSEDCVAA